MDNQAPDIVSGRNSVRELLRSKTRSINKILISKNAHGKPIEEIIALAKERNIPIHHVPSEKIDAMAGENSQGVAAEASPYEYLELEGLLEKVKSKEKVLLVVLDGIEDPHNLGAIIRNAAALGASGVIIGKWRAAGLTETVTRTSAGAIEHIPVARVTNIGECVNSLKKAGIWVAGADSDGKPITKEKFSFPLAVVIGSEGEGLHRLVKERCDYIVSIPQNKTISSLNASCASAVIIHEILNRN